MKRLVSILVAVSILSCAVTAFGQEAEPAGETVAWESDLDAALEKAKEKNSMVMIYFYKESSGYCADFEKFSINQPAVIELSKKFFCLKLERDKDKEVTARLGVSSVPTTLFVDPNRKKLGMVRGFEDPEPFAQKVKEVYESIEKEKKARSTLSENPDDLEANLELAKIWIIRDYRDQAIALFQKVVDKDPKNEKGFLIEAAFRLGHLQFEAGKFEGAKKSFEKVKKYDRGDSKGYADDMLLAEARMEAKDGNDTEALKKFRLFTNKFSSSELMHEALYFMGGVYYTSGNNKEAKEAWSKLVEKYPESKWAERAKDFIRQLDAGHGKNK